MPGKDKMECSCGHLGDCDPKYMDDLVGKFFVAAKRGPARGLRTGH